MSELKKVATRAGFGEEILKLGKENPDSDERTEFAAGTDQSALSLQCTCGYFSTGDAGRWKTDDAGGQKFVQLLPDFPE